MILKNAVLLSEIRNPGKDLFSYLFQHFQVTFNAFQISKLPNSRLNRDIFDATVVFRILRKRKLLCCAEEIQVNRKFLRKIEILRADCTKVNQKSCSVVIMPEDTVRRNYIDVRLRRNARIFFFFSA